MFSCLRRIRKIFQGGGTLFRHIFKRSCFSAKLFLSMLKIKALGGPGGMLPRNFFKNLHAVLAILVLFEQLLGKFC